MTEYVRFQKDAEAYLNGAWGSGMNTTSIRDISAWIGKDRFRLQLVQMIMQGRYPVTGAEAGLYSVWWFKGDSSIVSEPFG